MDYFGSWSLCPLEQLTSCRSIQSLAWLTRGREALACTQASRISHSPGYVDLGMLILECREGAWEPQKREGDQTLATIQSVVTWQRTEQGCLGRTRPGSLGPCLAAQWGSALAQQGAELQGSQGRGGYSAPKPSVASPSQGVPSPLSASVSAAPVNWGAPHHVPVSVKGYGTAEGTVPCKHEACTALQVGVPGCSLPTRQVGVALASLRKRHSTQTTVFLHSLLCKNKLNNSCRFSKKMKKKAIPVEIVHFQNC